MYLMDRDLPVIDVWGGRNTSFEMDTKSSEKWLVTAVRFPKAFHIRNHYWLANVKYGHNKEDPTGAPPVCQTTPWSPGLTWTPPVSKGFFLIHPRAQNNIPLLFTVCLRAKRSFKRRIVIHHR